MKLTNLTLATLLLVMTCVIFWFEPLLVNYHLVRILFHAVSVLVIGLILSLIFLKSVVNGSIKSEKLKNYLTLTLSITLCILAIEFVFTFIPKSHSWNQTLGSKNWFLYYWKRNSSGFRDTEHQKNEPSKGNIFFVGDSFTAGHGIRDTNDRYSDIIRDKLRNEFICYNLGINGADTKREFRILQKQPVKPDAIVLQYFGNDILGVAADYGYMPPGYAPYTGLNRWWKFIVLRSFIANYIFWEFPFVKYSSFFEFLEKVYKDKQVLRSHMSDLQKFVDYAKSEKIKLYVIAFPFLHDLELSRTYLNSITGFFQKNDIAIIDVAVIAKRIPFEERVVNLNDHHPSALLHLQVADSLHKLMRKELKPSEK